MEACTDSNASASRPITSPPATAMATPTDMYWPASTPNESSPSAMAERRPRDDDEETGLDGAAEKRRNGQYEHSALYGVIRSRTRPH